MQPKEIQYYLHNINMSKCNDIDTLCLVYNWPTFGDKFQ